MARERSRGDGRCFVQNVLELEAYSATDDRILSKIKGNGDEIIIRAF